MGIVQVTLPTTVYNENIGRIPNINPRPMNVTSPTKSNVSQFPLSFINGHIEVKVFIREGNPINITTIAPISK